MSMTMRYVAYGGFRVAHFCNLIGERVMWVNGKQIKEHRCTRHGFVDLIKYFGFAKAPVMVACPKCVEDHLEGTFVFSEELPAKAPVCEFCDEKNNLSECDICGVTCCPTHRIEGVCHSCSGGIDQHFGRGYAGL